MRNLSPQEMASLSRRDMEEAVRARAQIAYLGQQTVLARVLGNYKMYLRTDDDGFACHLMLDGFWESWVTQFLARTVAGGMTVFNVGAYVGYDSLLMASLVGPAGRVVAVEPNAQAAELLERTLALNGLTAVVATERVALGREDEGSATLFVPEGEPKNASVVGVEGRRGLKVVVRSTSLDALATDLPRVDLVKIDAEGSEDRILEGMRGTIERLRPRILMKFDPRRLDAPAATLDRLLDVYGTVREIDHEGELVEVSRDDLLDAGRARTTYVYAAKNEAAVKGTKPPARASSRFRMR